MKAVLAAIVMAMWIVPALGKERSATNDPSCLIGETRSVLSDLVSTFGPVKIVSTCREGAVIEGTHHLSFHAKRQAVDFIAPRGRKRAIVKWLAKRGDVLVMTYRDYNHIHFNTGQIGRAFSSRSKWKMRR